MMIITADYSKQWAVNNQEPVYLFQEDIKKLVATPFCDNGTAVNIPGKIQKYFDLT